MYDSVTIIYHLGKDTNYLPVTVSSHHVVVSSCVSSVMDQPHPPFHTVWDKKTIVILHEELPTTVQLTTQ